jgi:hypothetical protein
LYAEAEELRLSERITEEIARLTPTPLDLKVSFPAFLGHELIEVGDEILCKSPRTCRIVTGREYIGGAFVQDNGMVAYQGRVYRGPSSLAKAMLGVATSTVWSGANGYQYLVLKSDAGITPFEELRRRAVAKHDAREKTTRALRMIAAADNPPRECPYCARPYNIYDIKEVDVFSRKLRLINLVCFHTLVETVDPLEASPQPADPDDAPQVTN